MCGIVGVLSTEMNGVNHPYGKFFKQALFADTLRGLDSTGVFCLEQKDKDKQPETWKKALAAYDFLQLAHTNKLLRDSADFSMMIGHNRAATKGGIHHHTAHPFQIGDITLVHNGTVSNHRTLFGGMQFDVDSEAITHAINEEGYEKVIEKLDGAFTLIWHDAKDGSVNIVRNEERPLAFGKVKDKKTVLLSSEAHMLRWLAIRNGFSLETIVEPKPGELFQFWPYKDNPTWHETYVTKTVKMKEKWKGYDDDAYGGAWNGKKWVGGTSKSGNVSSLPVGKNEGLTYEAKQILKFLGIRKDEPMILEKPVWTCYPGCANKDVGKVTGTLQDVTQQHTAIIHGVSKQKFLDDISGKVLYSDVQRAAYDRHSQREVYLNNTDYITFEEGELPFTPEAEDKGKEEAAQEVAKFQHPDGLLTASAYKEATQDGCAYCTGNIDPADSEKTGWTNDRQPICKDCVRDFNLGQYLH